MIDLEQFGKQMGALVKEAVAPLEARIKELEIALESVDNLDVSEVVTEVLSRDELKTLVDLQTAESVVTYFAEHPVQHGKDGQDGKDGLDGKDGQNGRDGENGLHGKDGSNGKDGVGLAGAVINRSGELIITKTNGEAICLGPVVGKDGEKGNDGADFSDVEFDYDGERGLIIRGKGGEIVKRLPIPIDRGYWRQGMKAEKSDVYTEDGSAWIALKDTTTKPNRESGDWRMLVRKGRDGEQGPAGKEYVPPQPVKLHG